jgi:hypothetical protein
LAATSPTINFEVGQIGVLPIHKDLEKLDRLRTLATDNITLSRADWDSFETSWDFSMHPLMQNISEDRLLDTAYSRWKGTAEERFQTLRQHEEELNRILIETYDLRDELTYNVPDEEISIRRADLMRDGTSFLSIFIGCTFGRYSIGRPGLVYAGGESPAGGFPQSKHNIIPLTEKDYFGEEDIVNRLTIFLGDLCSDIADDQERRRVVAENLRWLAEAVDPKSTDQPSDILRKYFLRDFMKDHLKVYKNRPIYWLFDSGKQNGFKALVYLHRYQPDTVARLRTDYLLRLQSAYESEISFISMGRKESEITPAERRERESLEKKRDECFAYDKAVAHLAHLQVKLDLDDGVRINYMKFQNVDTGNGSRINLLHPVDMKMED